MNMRVTCMQIVEILFNLQNVLKGMGDNRVTPQQISGGNLFYGITNSTLAKQNNYTHN